MESRNYDAKGYRDTGPRLARGSYIPRSQTYKPSPPAMLRTQSDQKPNVGIGSQMANPSKMLKRIYPNLPHPPSLNKVKEEVRGQYSELTKVV